MKARVIRTQNYDFPVQALIAIVLIVNGVFLSFSVSPFLLQRESEGLASELLPPEWQNKVSIAFILAFAGWVVGCIATHSLSGAVQEVIPGADTGSGS